MEAIIEIVEKWAEVTLDVQPSLKLNDDGEATLKFAHKGECGDFDVAIAIYKSLINITLCAPNTLPDKNITLAIDAVARINQDMGIGHVEIMRNEKNWFRFRASIYIEDGSLSNAMLNGLFGVGVCTVDRYFPAILSICFAGVTPNYAIAKANEEMIDDAPIEKIIADSSSIKPSPKNGVALSPVLTAWADDLANAISAQADDNIWQMVGHGAIVVHDDMDRACDMLRRVAAKANMRFVSIESDEVMDIPTGAGDPFAKAAPILVYFEPGNWMKKISEDSCSEAANIISKFKKSLAARMEAFDTDRPVIYTTSAYKLDEVSSILRKRGLFDRYFYIPKLQPDMLGKEFIDLFGRENCDASITDFPGKVGKLLGDEFDNERLRNLAALKMARLVKRENRKLAFVDLVSMMTTGLEDSGEAAKDSEEFLHQTAVHEAGHVAMAVIDSNGKNTPEYSTIVAHKDSKGLVVESLSYSFAGGDLFTYADFRHKIHISLAGRAAEEVALGFDWISSGSKADLENCFKLASKGFADWGFAPNMNNAEASASNLAIILGNASNSEFLHNETLIRKFLAEEYKVTVKILNENRALLDAITDRLMCNSVLDQHEIAELYAAYFPVLQGNPLQQLVAVA